MADLGILPDYNYSKCKENAKKILKDYRRSARLVGAKLTDYKSPVVSDMPVSPSYGNGVENKVLEMVDAKSEFESVNAAIKTLSQEHFQVIYYTYVSSNPNYNDTQISSMMFNSPYSSKNVGKIRSSALIEFCENYKNGELLEFENGKVE